MNKKIKLIGLACLGICLGIMAYTSVHSFLQCQQDKVLVQGNQICKRAESTRHGDQFYIILDSQYGVVEIPVSYTKYITSSNDSMQRELYSPHELSKQLGDTPELQRDCPMIKYLGWYLFLWIFSVVTALTLFCVGILFLILYDSPYPLLGLGIMALGALLNIWL